MSKSANKGLHEFSKRTLSLKEKIPIFRALEDTLIMDGKDSCHYKPGYSDKILADKFKCLPHHIAHIRSMEFGKLSKRAALSTMDSGFMAEVRNRLDRIEQHLGLSVERNSDD